MYPIPVPTPSSGRVDEIIVGKQGLLQTGIAKLRGMKVIEASWIRLISGGVDWLRVVTQELSHEYVIVGTACARVRVKVILLSQLVKIAHSNQGLLRSH